MKRFFVAIAVLLLLGGCASTPQYSNIGGTSNNRPASTGINGSTTGAVLGGATGAAIASVANAKPEVKVFATIAGAAAGLFLGSKYDEEKAAIGSTDCGYTAQKTGTDTNGKYSQTARSRKTVPGYKADCN